MSSAYPIGKFVWPTKREEVDLPAAIAILEDLPVQVEKALDQLSAEALFSSYREGGWTRLQVVHHLADSHLNSLIRLKWTLTESTPTIKAYNQEAWANLLDYQLDARVSVQILKGIHTRMVAIYKSLKEEDWERSFVHPENGKTIPLWQLVALYAWHSRHHLEHIRSGI